MAILQMEEELITYINPLLVSVLAEADANMKPITITACIKIEETSLYYTKQPIIGTMQKEAFWDNYVLSSHEGSLLKLVYRINEFPPPSDIPPSDNDADDILRATAGIANYTLARLSERFREEIKKEEISTEKHIIILKEVKSLFAYRYINTKDLFYSGSNNPCLEITFSFDIVDEEEYVVGGEKYREGRDRFTKTCSKW